MNLVNEILREHSVVQKNKIMRYVGNDPRRFAALVKAFLNGPYRVTQRAGWPLSDLVQQHPTLIKPHLRALLQNLKKQGHHVAVKRNTVRLMQFIEIPTSLQGPVVNTCLKFLSDPGEPIAVRCFSMTVLSNLAEQQPDLRNEIIPMIQNQLPYATPGFSSRAKKTLRKLQRLS